MELDQVTLCEAEIKQRRGYVIICIVETFWGCWAYITPAYQAKREGFR